MEDYRTRITNVVRSYGELFNQNRIGPYTGTFEIYISRLFPIPFREVVPISYQKCFEQLIENRFRYKDEYSFMSDSVNLSQALNEKDFTEWLNKHTTKFTSFDLALSVLEETGHEFSYGMEHVADSFFIRGIIELDDPVNPTYLNGVEMPTEFVLFDCKMSNLDQYLDGDEFIDMVHRIAASLKINPVGLKSGE
ncbi:hypothetical protein [Bacillus pinisoli]|uniref:hypothetical protein n=1 Tax=Bacillus pinisoli TaxID=2901866 RepID=UPI001FF51934|nr:hypothetical protein [Bacillus pinisoli]